MRYKERLQFFSYLKDFKTGDIEHADKGGLGGWRVERLIESVDQIAKHSLVQSSRKGLNRGDNLASLSSLGDDFTTSLDLWFDESLYKFGDWDAKNVAESIGRRNKLRLLYSPICTHKNPS